jgi:hypothetical protein
VGAVFRKQSRGRCGHLLAKLEMQDESVIKMVQLKECLPCCSVAGWTYKAPCHQNIANREKYHLQYESVGSKGVDHSVHPSWWLTKKDFLHIKEGKTSCLKSIRRFDLHSLSQDFDVFLH